MKNRCFQTHEALNLVRNIAVAEYDINNFGKKMSFKISE